MREYVQLASTIKTKTRPSTQMLWSVKLDGVRALWIPTLRSAICPLYARTREPLTGLFTRYGSPIQAPLWFLDSLPPYPVDGELLWVDDFDVITHREENLPTLLSALNTGEQVMLTSIQDPKRIMTLNAFRSSFQKTVSVVRRKDITPDVSDRWKNIFYFMFDLPTYDAIFQDGVVNNNIVKSHMLVRSCFDDFIGKEICSGTTFIDRHSAMAFLYSKHERTVLPLYQQGFNSAVHIERYMERALEVGFEGLIGRDPNSVWTPKRTKNMVKLKPFFDEEGAIVGHNDGAGKYDGMLGSYRVSWLDTQGQRQEFDLSGMDDYERRHPRPLGQIVTFRYRTLSDAGLPREARLVRQRYAL